MRNVIVLLPLCFFLLACNNTNSSGEQSGSVTITATDLISQTPLAGLFVDIGGVIENPGNPDGEGNYNFDLPVGSYDGVRFGFDATAGSEYLPTTYNSITVRADETTALEELTAIREDFNQPADVGGTLVDTEGNTLFGVTLELFAGVNSTSGTPLRVTQIDEDGSYEFLGLDAGLYTVVVSTTPELSVQQSSDVIDSFTIFALNGPACDGTNDEACLPQALVDEITQQDDVVGAQEPPRGAVESTFDSGPEGWAVNLGNLIVQPGFISTTPPSERQTSMYIAPSQFLGDWTGFTRLTFDKRSSGGTYYQAGAQDIVLQNGFLVARRQIPEFHDGQWHFFSISLVSDAGWSFEGGATTLNDLLVSVSSLQIRAEYGSGVDESSLDNVRLE